MKELGNQGGFLKSLVKYLGIFVSLFFLSNVHAKGSGGFGLNVGLGVPFLTQGGVNYNFNDSIGVDVEYNLLSLSASSAKVELSMPALLLRWHPFKGSFYLAAGVGQETLTSKATDVFTNESAEIKVTAATTVGKLGWMWGSSDGGLWFGIDTAFVSPSNPKTDITTSLPDTNQAYIDAKEQGDKFGSTSFTNLTFARIGYLF